MTAPSADRNPRVRAQLKTRADRMREYDPTDSQRQRSAANERRQHTP
jgi:hypothetical protein